MSKRAFGTTLLLKGLEFDHAIVLDADDMNANNLYVALTRGSKTLTVVSKSRILTPKASRSRVVARNVLDMTASAER
jgi:DNA helicase-2/ATP-dependent DNA helicase PcrA